MIRFSWLLLLTLAALTAGRAAPRADDPKKDEGKGTVVDFDGLKSRAPASWKEEKPTNKMRFMQFVIPRSKGDKEDGELVIFKGLGGSGKQNVERWKQQFVAPEGKKIDDVATVKETKMAGGNALYLDIYGTYLFNPAPFNPASKAEKRPNYRMLAIHYEGPKDVYHIKLVGPAKTVEEQKKAFDDWLNSFK
jgi:hypothetical protein